jgi:hypothetical protein
VITPWGVFFAGLAASAVEWKALEPGIELAVIEAPVTSSLGDSKLTVVRINPELRNLKLLMASQVGGGKRTARAWAEEFDLAVVVNAGMFETEGGQTKARFLMKNFDHVNNPNVGAANSFLAFNPVARDVPTVQIIDRRCQNFASLQGKYHTLIQGIRMVNCNQKATWKAQPRKWSMVVIAVDTQGRVLFVFARSPYTVRDFIDMALSLPLAILSMMYLEGGPEASLLVSAGGVRVEGIGSFETGFLENDTNDEFWPIPNVLGVAAVPPPG